MRKVHKPCLTLIKTPRGSPGEKEHTRDQGTPPPRVAPHIYVFWRKFESTKGQGSDWKKARHHQDLLGSIQGACGSIHMCETNSRSTWIDPEVVWIDPTQLKPQQFTLDRSRVQGGSIHLFKKSPILQPKLFGSIRGHCGSIHFMPNSTRLIWIDPGLKWIDPALVNSATSISGSIQIDGGPIQTPPDSQFIALFAPSLYGNFCVM